MVALTVEPAALAKSIIEVEQRSYDRGRLGFAMALAGPGLDPILSDFIQNIDIDINKRIFTALQTAWLGLDLSRHDAEKHCTGVKFGGPWQHHWAHVVSMHLLFGDKQKMIDDAPGIIAASDADHCYVDESKRYESNMICPVVPKDYGLPRSTRLNNLYLSVLSWYEPGSGTNTRIPHMPQILSVADATCDDDWIQHSTSTLRNAIKESEKLRRDVKIPRVIPYIRSLAAVDTDPVPCEADRALWALRPGVSPEDMIDSISALVDFSNAAWVVEAIPYISRAPTVEEILPSARRKNVVVFLSLLPSEFIHELRKDSNLGKLTARLLTHQNATDLELWRGCLDPDYAHRVKKLALVSAPTDILGSTERWRAFYQGAFLTYKKSCGRRERLLALCDDDPAMLMVAAYALAEDETIAGMATLVEMLKTHHNYASVAKELKSWFKDLNRLGIGPGRG